VPQQPPAVYRDERVADLLDLAEQVRGDENGDPELGPDPPDKDEHRLPAGRIQPIGRLVEEKQGRVVDEGLGQLDSLFHAGRVAADQAVALLVQADMAQDVRGPLSRGRCRDARHASHVRDELGRGDVGWQAVVLRHVADPGPDPLAVGLTIHSEDLGRPVGRWHQAEEDLDQCALSCTVRADQPHNAGLDRDGELVERHHAPWVALGQLLCPDQWRSSRKRAEPCWRSARFGHCPAGCPGVS
jgi:hypothetical protein